MSDSPTSKIRNVAIIAHVDHGKTTLVDKLLEAGGAYRDNEVKTERAMDSMDLEREKGITIRAKNTAINYKDYTINIVDTPGHADFGGEVERVMKMVDGVLLLVDASDGPQAQTRFVLRKALANGLNPVVVVNKIDRPSSEPRVVQDKVLELFLELEANEEQFEAPFLFGSARDGYFMTDPDAERVDVTAILEAIVNEVPPPTVEEGPFRMLVSNIGWDDYVGRVAMGKVLSGTVKKGDKIFRLGRDNLVQNLTVTKVFEYSAVSTGDFVEGVAGSIVGVSGFEDIDIGETLSADKTAEPLPFIEIDPPTVTMSFSINDGPFAGKEGKHVTSREIRDRLFKETKSNVSIEVADSDKAGVFDVRARGSMQISVLVETMRREGFEVLVSRPSVIYKEDEETGQKLEPFEIVYVEVPEEHVNGVMRTLTARRAIVQHMEPHQGNTNIEAVIPTRGLIGFEFELLNLTSGHGVMSHLFKEYGAHCGDIPTRLSGTLVSTDTGPSTAYSLEAISSRGKLFIGPAEDIYVGQIIGENPRADDLPVNPTKEKHITNHRSSGDGKAFQLSPPIRFSLERALEYIAPDELVEATPQNIRLRKRILDPNIRKRMAKKSVVDQ